MPGSEGVTSSFSNIPPHATYLVTITTVLGDSQQDSQPFEVQTPPPAVESVSLSATSATSIKVAWPLNSNALGHYVELFSSDSDVVIVREIVVNPESEIELTNLQ